MKEAIVEASQNEDADITLPPSTRRFKDAGEKTKLCFDDIHATSIALQKMCLAVAEGRKLQEELSDEVNENCDNQDSHWYNNTFGGTYIPSDSAKRPNQDFINAVCKMQNRQKDKLISRETRAVKKWVGKKKVASSLANASSANLTLAERMSKKSGKKESNENKKRKADSISESTDDDDAFDHVFETAAEVE